MPTITIEEAQSRLAELIGQMHPGDEIVITQGQKPVARLIGEGKRGEKEPRQLGTLKGTVRFMAPDFDAPIDDFKEYME
jgi:antitoxin (DNA-binding transcriptional repressor) of toxin-antitoxin stability system